MAFVVGTYSPDTFNVQAALGWDYLVECFLAVNWDRGRAYQGIYAMNYLEPNGTGELATPISIFGVTTYNMTTGVPLQYIDLQAHFGATFYSQEDAIYSWHLLPKSLEGTGSDILAIMHTLNRVFPYVPASIDTVLTLVNLDSGAVIGSYALSKRTTGTNAVPYASDLSLVCNIGNTPNNWYVLAKRDTTGIGYTLLQITTNGTTGSIVEHIVNTNLGFSTTVSTNKYSTFRSDSDGASFWISDGGSGETNPGVHYVKFPFPYSAPVITERVVTYADGSGNTVQIPGVIYHKIGNTEYLVVSTQLFGPVEAVPDEYYARGYTFTDPTASYTNIYNSGFADRPWDEAYAFSFFGENVSSWQILSLGYGHNGNQKGITSVLMHDWATALPLDHFSILCVATGEITYSFTYPPTAGVSSVKYDYYLSQVSREVDATGDHSMMDLVGTDGGGMNIVCDGEEEPPEPDDEVIATIIESIGQFTGIIRAIAEQPCPVPGSTSYGACLTGRSSWPPGVGQILCGRDDVALPCD